MTRTTLLLGATTIAATAFALRRSGKMCLGGKVVLITGGSRGLGLALAREFADRGARLAICARNQEELDVAKEDLAQHDVNALTIQCDVSDRSQVERMVETTLHYYGHIDVLVNNAGVIHVGPIDTMTYQDFDEAMNVIFWGTVHTTLAVLPHMREKKTGRIVNITSVGGKVSVPHLLPYSCAKFASAAFSEGMRAELQGSGLKVITIAPGLMRTGSYLNALFKGAEKGEAAWFSLSSSLPGLSMSADSAAAKIVEATVNGSAERILSAPANILARFHGIFPGAAADLLGLINRALPNGRFLTERGSDSQVLQKPWLRALMSLGRAAAEQYLQPRRAGL